MARVLPDPLIGSFAPEVLRVHRALKGIPGDEFMVWVGLPLAGWETRPDFLVVHADSTAFVITVADVREDEVEERLNGSLFSPLPAAEAGRTAAALQLGDAFRQRVRSFIATSLEWDPTAAELAPPEGPPAVYGLVLYPGVSHELLRQLWPDNPSDGCYWLGEEYLSSEKLAACLGRLATGGLEERQLARLRSHFTPEAVVPLSFSARGRLPRNLSAEFTPLLLDYDQEAWAKNRLRLPDEAGAVAEAPVPYGEAALVTGVAGSGKSLVLLFRACTQAQLDPTSRALVLTHNRALRRELETRFGELGRPANVEWHTFFSWVESCLPAPARAIRIVQYKARDAMIVRAASAVGEVVTAQWVEFLRDEFDWMQDRGVTGRDEYLAVERVGRGTRLTAEQRVRVHRVYEGYRAQLRAMDAEDWSGRALRFWRGIDEGEFSPEAYDFIYVDEAQFFAPVWLRALRRALRPGSGRLLLAADPTQGFLKRRQSWVACGLDLRGRSTRLRKSYRNSRPILQFAAAFYHSRLQDEDEGELNLPDETELASAEPGEEPAIVRLTSRQDEVARVINEVKSFLKRGGDPEAVLVLVSIGMRTTAVHDDLVRELGSGLVADARQTSGRGRVRVCSIDGATGLEAPIVFLIGGAELLEREDDLQLPADQREELRRDNTRRLYMGFTRAGLKLFITWVGALPPVWAGRFGD